MHYKYILSYLRNEQLPSSKYYISLKV